MNPDHWWCDHVGVEGRSIIWQLAGLLDASVSPWVLALFLAEEGWSTPVNMTEILEHFYACHYSDEPLLIPTSDPMRGFKFADGSVADGSGGSYSAQEWQDIQDWLKS